MLEDMDPELAALLDELAACADEQRHAELSRLIRQWPPSQSTRALSNLY